jgi:hypothetical protein
MGQHNAFDLVFIDWHFVDIDQGQCPFYAEDFR